MVGGEDGHERVTFGGVANVNCGERDGGGRVAADGFREDALARGGGQLLFERRGLLGVSDAPNAIGCDERTKTRNGLLQHCLFADDVEELLWSARAAARPEARAAATGKDYCMN